MDSGQENTRFWKQVKIVENPAVDLKVLNEIFDHLLRIDFLNAIVGTFDIKLGQNTAIEKVKSLNNHVVFLQSEG